jgi:hypothetical protein
MAVFKFDIKYGTDYLYNLTDILIHYGFSFHLVRNILDIAFPDKAWERLSEGV